MLIPTLSFFSCNGYYTIWASLLSSTTHLYCDNMSIIQIAHNNILHERIKHIEFDCHLVCYHLLQGSIVHTTLLCCISLSTRKYLHKFTFPKLLPWFCIQIQAGLLQSTFSLRGLIRISSPSLEPFFFSFFFFLTLGVQTNRRYVHID